MKVFQNALMPPRERKKNISGKKLIEKRRVMGKNEEKKYREILKRRIGLF